MAHYSIMIRAMILNSLILIGFLLLMTADLLWTKGRSSASALRRTGYVIVGCAFGLLVLAPDPFWPFPVQERLAGWTSAWRPGPALGFVFIAIAAASGTLLLWSVFLEIGIARKRLGLRPFDVVTSGTYSLCRHPGFWWLAILVSAVGAVKGFEAYFLPVSMMVFLDLLLVLLQDRYTFPKVFPAYDDYKKSVPFLIPLKRSERPPRNQAK